MKDSKINNLSESVYCFADCELDCTRRELRREGVLVELQPRVFDLLVYLASQRNRAVDKDELQDAVWPGMVITETALTRAVMKARKAVGDDAASQKVIRTLHGHGYRFVADLLPAGQTEPAAAQAVVAKAGRSAVPARQAAVAAAQGETAPVRIPWLPIALLVALAAAALGWWQFRGAEPAAGELRLAVLPLDNRTEDPDLLWTRLGLMSFVSGQLGAENELPVVADGSVVSLVDDLGWSGSFADGANPELLDRLRTVFRASHLLAMDLQAEGPMLRMNYRLLNPGGTTSEGTMVGDEPTELAKGVVQAVYGLLLKRSRLGSDLPMVSVDPFNNEAFARGMSLSLEGRCSEAEQYFRLIVKQEPSLFSPRYELASCLRILGQASEAESILVQLVAEQEALGATRSLAQALMVLGILYNRTGRLDEADATHRRALQISRQIDDPELSARILQNLAIVAEDRNDWDASWELLDLAVLEYQRAGREAFPGQLYSARANLKMDQGDLLEAEGYLQQALQAFRAAGDRRNEAMMLNNTGYLRRLQGRLDEAEQFHLQSLAIREEIGDRVGVGRNYGMLTVVLTARGELAQAKETALQAIDIARETHDRLFEGTSLAQLGDVEHGLGEDAAAREHYLEASAVFESIQDRMRVLQCAIKLGQLDLAEGRYEAVEAMALQVIREAGSLDLLQPEIEAMELLGDLRRNMGELRAADAEYAAALDRLRHSSWAGQENTLLVKRVEVLLELSDLEQAAPLVGALSQQEDNPSSLRVQARFAFRSEDATRAAEIMDRARALAGTSWPDSHETEYQAYRRAAGLD